MQQLLAAFYGDDFTGSTENLAQFCRHGLRGRLFFSTAKPETIREMATELEVVGLAGTARGLSPEAMTREVEPSLALMEELQPRILQYKVCSTFDSSPEVGSIGHVMELARQRWPGCALPVLPATPAFGRFTAFSNLFTRYAGSICRLDHHPGMAHHPSTPMKEADLRRHLADQTSLPSAAVTLLDYRDSDGGWQVMADAAARESFMVLDATDQRELEHAASLIMRLAEQRKTLAVAAQGLADALGRLASLDENKRFPLPEYYAGVGHLLVLSGSCSPQTQLQLEDFSSRGGEVLGLQPETALDDPEAVLSGLIEKVAWYQAQGKNVAVATTRQQGDVVTKLSAEHLSRSVGGIYARLTCALRERGLLPRVVFAGGDTSSHAMRQMGADSLELIAFDGEQSGHLCRLSASGAAIDGLEVVLKGGQIGGKDFFARVRQGT
ncbi:four-carbon acid sugar kinase family protein [Billgrantia diversa]|uniref:four-carbon acid sugar kinase family protein n=1 Tax=Halomonas sp. MCCC 1A13316 TaxID=2733487 RepID=UPI0018A64E82|nr:four-carbon acid sugar kinase family protein [Halomonas sp. MCCC 1A13316]QOR39040.1 four-carbon acid sugar kinase family protein [Halomonas sp. MCCC 1A13316]